MRLYRALLHLYPASFRAEYGPDLCDLFGRRLQEVAGPSRAVVWAARDCRHRAERRAIALGPSHPRFAVCAPQHGQGEGVCSHGHPRGGPRNRRDHRGLFDYRSRPRTAPALPRVRSARASLAGPGLPRLPANGAVAEQLRRLEAAGHVVRWHVVVLDVVCQSRQRGRPGAVDWCQRDL